MTDPAEAVVATLLFVLAESKRLRAGIHELSLPPLVEKTFFGDVFDTIGRQARALLSECAGRTSDH